MNKVFVVIVTYNGMKWIDECLSSVLNSSIPVSVVVIDNNSSDETITFVKDKFSEITIFEQTDNLGFGKANNLGMSYALSQNADFVFLLNQDAFVNKKTIEDLVALSLNNPEYGILSPVQLDYSGKLLENYFFRFMSEDGSRSFYSDFVLGNPQKKIYDIDFVQAAAWLLPINTINKIGGFDPLFYHYGEDNNYCQRLLYHNMRIGVAPNTYIRHDSNKPKSEQVKLFSKKYFDTYIKEIAVKYADINIDFIGKNVSSERKKIYKIILYNFFKLDFIKLVGFLKQLHVLNKTVKRIEVSRNRNIHINSNYLNFE
ncbi:glycosyltransferase family 2 protein [Flavobacterium aestivum]|uniref:glycosyltransferase family 2 protein n=1 Tax=Flavobacterium aestivum TaxID=3003257 RepID=UPI00248328D7|nr:glycosyltransferase family 2 protein [Flavobacterium aestivum]